MLRTYRPGRHRAGGRGVAQRPAISSAGGAAAKDHTGTQQLWPSPHPAPLIWRPGSPSCCRVLGSGSPGRARCSDRRRAHIWQPRYLVTCKRQAADTPRTARAPARPPPAIAAAKNPAQGLVHVHRSAATWRQHAWCCCRQAASIAARSCKPWGRRSRRPAWRAPTCTCQVRAGAHAAALCTAGRCGRQRQGQAATGVGAKVQAAPPPPPPAC